MGDDVLVDDDVLVGDDVQVGDDRLVEVCHQGRARRSSWRRSRAAQAALCRRPPSCGSSECSGVQQSRVCHTEVRSGTLADSATTP